MRTIEYTTQFKRDYKREIKGKHKAVFSNLFIEIVDTLARDEPLAAKHRIMRYLIIGRIIVIVT
jgi:mRNA interferase YafQ